MPTARRRRNRRNRRWLPERYRQEPAVRRRPVPRAAGPVRVPGDLASMLTFMRPAGSKAEAAFIERFLRPLGLSQDPAGNLHRRIGSAPVLWSCHTDTVHDRAGRQALAIGRDGVVRLDRRARASCLGADDTAGVWLLSEMIRAGVEGLYVFHRAEECGGLGSSFIADETPEVLDGITCAIALDRKGTDSVITRQGTRCASDTFAEALAEALGGTFKPDPHGLFTDTANYTAIVPECTNLSVGYDDAHSAHESLDVGFLLWLRDRLLHLDTTRLPIERDPHEWEVQSYGWPDGDDLRWDDPWMRARSDAQDAEWAEGWNSGRAWPRGWGNA